MKEIKTLQDIADIINKGVDNGTEEVKEHIRSKTKNREELEELALKMAIMISMIPDFLKQSV